MILWFRRCLVLPAATLALGCQRPATSDLAPSETARAFFDALAHSQWDSAAALVDSEWLVSYHARQVVFIQSIALGRKTLGPEGRYHARRYVHRQVPPSFRLSTGAGLSRSRDLRGLVADLPAKVPSELLRRNDGRTGPRGIWRALDSTRCGSGPRELRPSLRGLPTYGAHCQRPTLDPSPDPNRPSMGLYAAQLLCHPRLRVGRKCCRRRQEVKWRCLTSA